MVTEITWAFHPIRQKTSPKSVKQVQCHLKMCRIGLERPLICLLHSFRFQTFKDFLQFYVSKEVTGTRMTRPDILSLQPNLYTEYMWHIFACRRGGGASQERHPM